MSGNGRLTELLTRAPRDTRKFIEYARSKNVNLVELLRLAMSYIQAVQDINFNRRLPPLHVACMISKPEIVKLLVKEGWSVNNELENVESPLYIALNSGNIPVARLLLELGADAKSMCCGKTPMVGALTTSKQERTCISALKLLLKAGVSVNAVLDVHYLNKPIHVATCNNLPSVVSFLLQMGADCNAEDINHSTPLHFAVYNKRIEIIKLLTLHKVDFYIENAAGETPLQCAVKQSSNQAVEALVLGGCDVNADCGGAVTAALHTAVILCNLDMVKLLIKLGADPNKSLKMGMTPLHVVSHRNIIKNSLEEKEHSKNRKDIAEFLVENGGNINYSNQDCNTPIDFALLSGLLGLAKVLVRLGANINIRLQTSDETLFHKIVAYNRDIIVTFLEYGGDYTACNNNSLTPYHFALSLKVDVKFIKSFVTYGCPYNQNVSLWSKVSERCNMGAEHFFLAEKHFFKGLEENNLNLVKSAVSDGAVVTGCSEEIKYPLHFVALRGYKELLTFLLENNVPPNSLNELGETALYVAAKQGDYVMCCILLKFGASYNYYNKMCPKKPKIIANEFNHKTIVDLLQEVSRMFKLARLTKKYVITELENKLKNDINDYLIFANAMNIRGDTLLATALHYNRSGNAQQMLKLRLSLCEL